MVTLVFHLPRVVWHSATLCSVQILFDIFAQSYAWFGRLFFPRADFAQQSLGGDSHQLVDVQLC